MFERLLQVNTASDEPQALGTARKVAAVVATLAADITGFSEFDHRALPAGFPAKIIGYVHGFSLAICAAWRVEEASVSIEATRFAVRSLFPQVEKLFLNGVVDEVVSCADFSSGNDAGRVDGERYVATGRKGTALMEIL
jgi:hypothetical protein